NIDSAASSAIQSIAHYLNSTAGGSFWICFHVRDAHGDSGDSTDDIPFPRIANMADLYARLGRRDQDQLIPVEFTPAARVTPSEFDKIDWTVELVLPTSLLNLVLSVVNLHERAGSDVWVKGIIL